MARKIVIVFLMCSSAMLWGQVPGSALVVIKAGALFDAHTGRLLANQAILVDDDRIKQVGDAGSVAKHVPSTARVIDLSSFTVLPGLIDCHAHVRGNLKDLTFTREVRTSSAMGVLWGVHNLQIWLDHGFTAIRRCWRGRSFLRATGPAR